MTLLVPRNQQGFTACDALIFPHSLGEDVRKILPVPASVGFCFHAPHLREFGVKNSQQIRERERKGNVPFLLNSRLVIPLLSTPDQQVDVVIYDVDSKLLEKMAQEWLVELQETIIQQLSICRQRYIDPGTGLYNQRALSCVATEKLPWKTLFLIATVSRRRTVAGGYQKVSQLASLLQAVIQEPLFYFGQGVFGTISHQQDRKEACRFSRRLISRLKREKLYRIHIGFSSLVGHDSREHSFVECWNALAEAERRGPFSLCDASSLQTLDQHPFALPDSSVVRSLQRKWCGLDRFGLACFSVPKVNRNGWNFSSLLTEGEFCMGVTPHEQIVFFPDLTRKQTTDRVHALAREIKKTCGELPAAGYSNWPTAVEASRLDCIRQCRKALLHGSFYGPDAIVGFDFISVNVSGDYYFDEGDYKKAIKEYRLGLKMQPDDENLLNSLGVALAEVNRHREALVCFSRVLKSWPDNYMALVNKGMSCRYRGQELESVDCFEKALLSPAIRSRCPLNCICSWGGCIVFLKSMKPPLPCLNSGKAQKENLKSSCFSGSWARHILEQAVTGTQSVTCSILCSFIPAMRTVSVCLACYMCWKMKVQTWGWGFVTGRLPWMNLMWSICTGGRLP